MMIELMRSLLIELNKLIELLLVEKMMSLLIELNLLSEKNLSSWDKSMSENDEMTMNEDDEMNVLERLFFIK